MNTNLIERLKEIESAPITGYRRDYTILFSILLSIETKEEMDNLFLLYDPSKFDVMTTCCVIRGCGARSNGLDSHRDLCIRAKQYFDSIGENTNSLLIGIIDKYKL